MSLKSPDESEQILKILQAVLSRRRQAIADWILAERFAEGVAKGPTLSKLHVHSHRNVQSDQVGAEVLRGQSSVSKGLLDLFLGTGEMHEAGSHREVWTQPTVPRTKIDEKVCDRAPL